MPCPRLRGVLKLMEALNAGMTRYEEWIIEGHACAAGTWTAGWVLNQLPYPEPANECFRSLKLLSTGWGLAAKNGVGCGQDPSNASRRERSKGVVRRWFEAR